MINIINTEIQTDLSSRSTSLVDETERKVLDYLKKNHYKVGDSLPNEAQLSASLGIARGVLREALSPLKMIGLIGSRTRRGMFLQEPSFLKGLKIVIDPDFMSEDAIFNLLELRMAIEIGISNEIFDNITPEDLSQLEEIVKISSAFENNSYSPISEFTFHSKLYQITGNKFIMEFQQIIHPIMDFIKDKFNDYIKPINVELQKRGDIVTHADLLELLKKNDKEGYKLAIENHFKVYRLFIKIYKSKKTGSTPIK